MASFPVPLEWVRKLLGLARQVDGVLQAQDKASRAIARLQDEIQALKLEVERLKAREELLIEQARSAAATAAANVAMQSIADLARRIGSLEARQPVHRPLPPPSEPEGA
jgi:hypothetical protein